MAININKVIEDRIQDEVCKLAREQAATLEAIIKAELDRMGISEFHASPHSFLSQLRVAIEEKAIRERVNLIVDGLLAPSRVAGDTVVITTPSHMSKEGRDKLSAYVLAQSGCNAMVLDGGATFSGMLSTTSNIDEALARLDAHNLT